MSKKGKKGLSHNKKKDALHDHKRKGKKFITPLNQIPGGLKYVRWANDMLPELIWMGCIIEHSGIRDGVNHCLTLARIANEYLNGTKGAHSSKISSYQHLNGDHKQAIINKLTDEKLYAEISAALIPLNELYPKSPLVFLKQSINGVSNDKHVLDMKNIVKKYFSRATQPAMIIQANAVCIAICARKFDFTSQAQLPNLDLIIDRFGTEDAARESSKVRALTLLLFDNSDSISSWGEYFWNRGLDLESCNFNGNDNVK